MSIEVTVTNAHRRYRVRHRPTTDYVRRVMEAERKRTAFVSVVFVDAGSMRRLNRKFLGHNDATDVLSFPLSERDRPDGEIYVNADRARAQARDYGVSFTEEIARLVIHGALHLVGYDDTREGPARKMKAVEERHLKYWFGKNRKAGG